MHLEKTQFEDLPPPIDTISLIDLSDRSKPFITRSELQAKFVELSAVKPDWVMYSTSTSGSTGEPVSVYKSYLDYVWYQATNVREILWHKWDSSLNQASIKPFYGSPTVQEGWGLPRILFPKQGNTHMIGYRPISEIQIWLEQINPHYIYAAPTIFKQLDLSKISNFKGWRGTGEKGGTNYSSEECGTIALQCPDNPENYHVMENQLVEVDEEGHAIISTLSSPYIRKYKHGDIVTLGECSCGRKLKTITAIHGRVRNMFIFSNGDKKWPLFGSRNFHTNFGIKRFKMIQTHFDRVLLKIQCDVKVDQTLVQEEVRRLLEYPVHVDIEYVDFFPDYKFEEFVSFVGS